MRSQSTGGRWAILAVICIVNLQLGNVAQGLSSSLSLLYLYIFRLSRIFKPLFFTHEYSFKRVMMKSVSSWLLVLPLSMLISLSDVKAYPKQDLLEDKDGFQRESKNLSSFNQLADEQENGPPSRSLRKEILHKIQEILGIQNQSKKLDYQIPQFMIGLYNTVTDSNGFAQISNPYNAEVVQCFIEKDTTQPNFYYFDISSLDKNESILGAELHLYRKKKPLENPISYPYYFIKIYQVLKDRSLDTPDLHRLLDIYYVSAEGSGWQVLDVMPAVLAWLNGDPNLGLLITTSNLFEKKVSIEFLRRNDHHYDKQPILVLFNNISNYNRFYKLLHYNPENGIDEKDRDVEEESEEKSEEEKINSENNSNDTVEFRFKILENGQPEDILPAHRNEPEFFHRSKRRREGNEKEKRSKDELDAYDDYQDRESEALTLETMERRRRRDIAPKKKGSAKIVSRNHTKKISRVLTSMDIYERTEFRERSGRIIRLNQSIAKQRRSVNNQNAITTQSNTTQACARHSLYVDFEKIGLSEIIIAPSGYSAYQCKGVCESPISQDQRPTNHATIQAIAHKVGLVEDIAKSCCVPTKLQSINILFIDNGVVALKKYEDMVAKHCGCR